MAKTVTVKIPSNNQPHAAARRKSGRVSRKGRAKRTTRRQGAKARPLVRMSDAGQAFLKCAYAPPDFNRDPGKGIPDRYNGKSLGVKHAITYPISFSEGTDAYIVLAPTPGVAFWSFSVPAGTALTSALTQLDPTVYPGFTQLFGDPATGGSIRASNVEAFRFASSAIGIYPTSNHMQFAGSISVWKIPLKLSTESRVVKLSATAGATTTIDTLAVNGLSGIELVSRENYTESFIKGCYTISTCNQPEFEFKPIIEGVAAIPQPVADYAGAAAVSSMYGSLRTSTNQVFLGLGDMETVVIKVSTPTGAVNSAVIKTWACVEYRPNPTSALYQYASTSPPYDPVALEAYRRISASLPTAVECAENAAFWERVKSIMRGFSRVLSYAPGPVGMVGSGMGAVMDGLEALFI